MTNNDEQVTIRLLQVMVALLVRGEGEDARTLREQVLVLDDLGLRPTEIAQILGRSSTYINKELSGLRKTRKSSKEVK
jgi:hypothetical protein